MKRLLCNLVAMLVLGTIGAMAQKYTITGSLTCDSLRFSPVKMEKIYLKHTIEGVEVVTDSAQIVDGTFRFEGRAPKHAEMVQLSGFDNGAIFLLLEPGDITIAPFNAQFPAAAQISGTENNVIFTEYMDLMNKNAKDSRVRMKELFASLPKEIMDDPALFQPYQYSAYHGNSVYYKVDIMDFLLKHQGSVASLYMIKHGLYKMFTPEEVERLLLSSVPEELRQHPVYKEMLNQVRADNLQVGAKGPEVVGLTPEGNELALSELRGKYVLLDVWASWCGPCRREFPFMHQVMKQSEGKDNFVILSYSIDSKGTDWLACIEKNNLRHPNWLHISTLKGWGSDVVKLYGVSGVPHTVLLDPDGCVVEFNLRGQAMVDRITAILNGQAPEAQGAEVPETEEKEGDAPVLTGKALDKAAKALDKKLYKLYQAITPRVADITEDMTPEEAQAAVRATNERIRFVLEHNDSPLCALLLEHEIHQGLAKEYAEKLMHALSPTIKEHPAYLSYKKVVDALMSE